MLRTVKPKTARGKRALEQREPKLIENTKSAFFLKGTTTSMYVNQALKELCQLKKPDAVLLNKRNAIHPFEDASSLEFFSQKQDASLFVFGSHSKKRPHCLVFGRLFNYEVLEMVELMLTKNFPMELFKSPKSALGSKPCFAFNGDMWESNDTLARIKNLFLDFFRGTEVETINLSGLDHVISMTASSSNGSGDKAPQLQIFFRVYRILLKKSGSRLPRVELEEMGPALDFVVGRTKLADADTWKEVTKVPKSLLAKKVKNISHDNIGDKRGRVHVGNQDLDKIQTRKIKGLRKRPSSSQDGEAGDSATPKAKRARTAIHSEDA